VANLRETFYDCQNLRSLTLDLPNCTTFQQAFYNCWRLNDLKLICDNGLNFEEAFRLSGMLLEDILFPSDTSLFNFDKATNVTNAFRGVVTRQNLNINLENKFP